MLRWKLNSYGTHDEVEQSADADLTTVVAEFAGAVDADADVASIAVVMLNTFLRFNENVYINFHFSTHACLEHVIYSLCNNRIMQPEYTCTYLFV